MVLRVILPLMMSVFSLTTIPPMKVVLMVCKALICALI